MNKKDVQYKKIVSRITLFDYMRLRRICRDFGFKSPYEVLQYLMHCFLRAADPENDQQLEPLPSEIRKMLNIDTIKKLRKNLPHSDNDGKSEIEKEFETLSDVQLPVYGQGMKYRKTKQEIKASRYE